MDPNDGKQIFIGIILFGGILFCIYNTLEIFGCLDCCKRRNQINIEQLEIP